jgi:negative regulator of sigma E activity
MGAINAFGIVADNHFITTVGQVPGKTVEKIGRSIKTPD